jgi:polyphosphate kinase
VVPVLDPALRDRLMGLLDLALSDNRLAWDLDSDGRWTPRSPAPGEEERNYHDLLMADALQRSREAIRPWEVTL